MPRDGVPKGRSSRTLQASSKVYPGVERSCWVYVPAQYDGSREVSLMVFNDGATYLKADGYLSTRTTSSTTSPIEATSPQ